jgi:two-component system, response regulator
MGTKSDDDVRFGGVMSEAEILLVEDDSNCEELALRALKRAGYLNVAVARDGLEALGMLSGEGGDGGGRKPEAVLLDMRLPKLGGIAVLQRLRSDVRTRDLKVFALSASEDPAEIEQCLSLGVLAVLPKPLDAETLKIHLS